MWITHRAQVLGGRPPGVTDGQTVREAGHAIPQNRGPAGTVDRAVDTPSHCPSVVAAAFNVLSLAPVGVRSHRFRLHFRHQVGVQVHGDCQGRVA